jgi:hypothetical protein
MNPHIDHEQEKAALLEIHAQDRRAHFGTDADLLLAHSADQFISVSNGEIHTSRPAERKAFFTNYFTGATYHEWDDVEPPIVRISDDASMAWMIVRTRVRRTTRLEGSEETRETSFVYAGIMTYEKQDGKWVRVANVSTFA